MLAAVFYVFILFFIGIKDCCAILVKTYGNLNCGSIEALTSAYSTTDVKSVRLHRRFDAALGCGV